MNARAEDQRSDYPTRFIPLFTERHVYQCTLVNCAGVIYTKGVDE